ncbi:MAG: hypothetical protein JSW08_01175 [archaeon]|nr:MAG: hypothetical protein JSW08_01175 [archaeon]
MAEPFSVATNPLFYKVILPFILVFAVVFAILDKAEILGEGKRMTNLIVAFAIAFIFIGVPSIVNVALTFIPIVALIIVILLCLLLLLGFANINIKKNKTLKTILGIVLGIAVVVAVLWSTGIFKSFSNVSASPNTIGYIVFIAIFVVAIIAVVAGGKKPSSKEED